MQWMEVIAPGGCKLVVGSILALVLHLGARSTEMLRSKTCRSAAVVQGRALVSVHEV